MDFHGKKKISDFLQMIETKGFREMVDSALERETMDRSLREKSPLPYEYCS